MPKDHRKDGGVRRDDIEDPGQPDLPEQDHEVPPDRRTRREAGAERLELNRTGMAAAGALLDADPDLDRTSETEAELEETVAKRERRH
ncbi:MAG: hypothetical protein AB7O56_03365 [Bauldia sp.]